MNKNYFSGILIATLFFASIGVHSTYAQLSFIHPITFPVIGTVSFGNDFGDPRSGGRTHEGNDIMGKKMMPLVAAVDGTITNVNYPEATWGYSVTIRDSEGFRYAYLHMNNDNPGTDDGKGDGFFAYAPDIKPGNKVVKGQLIGWMGDSGNAETTAPHLHFEIRGPNNDPLNPYDSLKQATRITEPVKNYPVSANEIVPYGDFKGGLALATANLDTDSDYEIVTGAGPGGGPLVRVFEKDGTPITSFYAYDATFRGGIDVTAADTDSDGKAEIITAAGPGGGPHIKIFKTDGTLVKEFFAYDTRFRGGVFISAADMNGDGAAEIVVGPGAGGGPHVKVVDTAGVVKKELMAYGSFTGGVDVAAFSRSSSGAVGGFITAPGKGGGPHVKVFDANAAVTKEFFAYDGNFNVGVRIAAGIISGNSQTTEIATVPATGGGPHLKRFKLDGTQTYSDVVGFESWWRGGYDVALGQTAWIGSAASTRRASVRNTVSASSSNGNWWQNF